MPRGQAWKKQAPGEQLQEHTGPLLRCAVAVKRHNLLWIDKMFLFLSSIFFLSSFSLLSFSWRPYFPSVHFLFSYFFSLLSLSLLSSSSPLTSSTVPVLPPFAPPARIDFVLVNLELRGAQGRDNGHWAEVNRAGRGYFLHSMVVISSAESFLDPHAPTPLPPAPPVPHGLLHSTPSSLFFFFFQIAFCSFSHFLWTSRIFLNTTQGCRQEDDRPSRVAAGWSLAVPCGWLQLACRDTELQPAAARTCSQEGF